MGAQLGVKPIYYET